MANTVLTRTPSSASNQKTFTMSVWVKRLVQGAQSAIMCVGNNPSSSMFMLRFDPDTFNIYGHGSNPNITTHRKFYDPTAWYHVVLAVDTTQASASDRVKLYVNGVQETSFSTASYPSQNDDLLVNSTTQIHIGERPDDNVHFDGCMSHFHFIDGTAYPASTFGETDSSTGEWKIKTSPSVTYGTNGFLILKDGISVTDQSGNSNNFTVSQGSLTKSEDNPSNNFCTLNPMSVDGGSFTIANGGTAITASADNKMLIGTMHSSAGYYEAKLTGSGHGSAGKGVRIGLAKLDGGNAVTYSGISGNSGDLERFIGIQNTPGNYVAVYNNGYTVTDYSGNSWSQNDIVQVAWKNNKIWYGVNGTWLGSGDPSNGTNEADTLDTTGSFYTPAIISSLDGATGTQFNFGNGYFGTTAVSSAGTNASNIGIFEYDVPTGCTAVSTKGLNE